MGVSYIPIGFCKVLSSTEYYSPEKASYEFLYYDGRISYRFVTFIQPIHFELSLQQSRAILIPLSSLLRSIDLSVVQIYNFLSQCFKILFIKVH
jgi:hypothetical protein